jgi:exonuclease III
MKFLSFNCRGVASPSKKYSMKRMVESIRPNLILFQETMGEDEEIVRLLESLFKQWIFLGVDVICPYGGWPSDGTKTP